MVKTCCVKNCDIAPKGNVTCFRFPNNRFLKRKWIDAIGLSNKLTANSTVCIKHFQEDDYDIVRGRPRLKAKVIPSVFGESDKQSHSSCITEDDIVINEITTEITLKNVHKVNLNLSDSQNEVSIELHNDSDVDVRTKNTTALGNKGETESSVNIEQDINAKPQDNGSTTINSEGITELHKEDRIEFQNDVKSPRNMVNVQNEYSTELINDKNDVQNAVVQNDVVQNDVVQNDVVQNAVVQNDVVQNAVVQNDVQNEDSTKSQIDGSTQNNENVIEEQKNRKSKPNGVILKEKNNEKGYQDSFIESTTKPSGTVDDLNKDIEEIIVNYQIKQTRPVHAAAGDAARADVNGAEDAPGAAAGAADELLESDPVFIEVAVQGDRAGSPRDCLMVLESVQVELDPNTFLEEEEPDDCHETVDLADDDDDNDQDGRPDPISLLTSSDEDEVIIQEPHIDTVEVSDETDEDDVPLVKLLKRSKKKKKPKISIWNAYEYFCMDCQYTATSRQEYKAHTAKHSTILQVCEICDYTTASKSQFSRHKRKHKEDRKYKCHLCDYKARHNMSLIYHLKSHRALSSAKKGFRCDKCGFKSDVKTVVLRHVKLCTTNVQKYSCNKCVYETKRPSDLKRHKARRHNEDQDDDEEFVP